jgi:hypothetical protein
VSCGVGRGDITVFQVESRGQYQQQPTLRTVVLLGVEEVATRASQPVPVQCGHA